MMEMYINYLKARFGNKKGQGMVEYGLIIALVAIGLIIVIGTMKDELVSTFTTITGQLTDANSAATSTTP